VIFDANIPEDGIAHLLKVCAGKPVFAIAVSPAKAVRLKPFLSQIGMVFTNKAEALALTDLPADAGAVSCVQALRNLGVNGAMISDGSGPLIGFDRNTTLELQPPGIDAIVDVTGAGDALAAAASITITSGKPIGEAMREGTAAAIAAITSASAVPGLDRKSLDRMVTSLPVAGVLQRAS
jgi:sugar/nucleoside kinase (ribokinase family)